MVDTYTNHPAYQTPIRRPRQIVSIRYYFGMSVGLMAWLLLLLSEGFLLYQFAVIIESIFDANLLQRFVLHDLLGFLLNVYAIIFLKSLIPWCRHLTRPNSREFV